MDNFKFDAIGGSGRPFSFPEKRASGTTPSLLSRMSEADISPPENSVDETLTRPASSKNQRSQRPHSHLQSHHPHPPPPLHARLEPPAIPKQYDSLSARLSLPEPSHPPLVDRVSVPEQPAAMASLKRKTPPSPHPSLFRRISPPQASSELLPFQGQENSSLNTKPSSNAQVPFAKAQLSMPPSSTVPETLVRPSSSMELETPASPKSNETISAGDTTVNSTRDSPSSSPISITSLFVAPPPPTVDETPCKATVSNLNAPMTIAQSASAIQPASSNSDSILPPHLQPSFPTHVTLSAHTSFHGSKTDNIFSSPVPANPLDYSSLAFHMSPIWAECAAQAMEWNEVAEQKERGELLVDMNSPSIRRKRPRDDELEPEPKRAKPSEQSIKSAPAPAVDAVTNRSAVNSMAIHIPQPISSAAESNMVVVPPNVREEAAEEEDEEEKLRAIAEYTRLEAERAADVRRKNLEQELAIKQREEERIKTVKIAKERAEDERLLKERAEAERQLKLQEKLLKELNEVRRRHEIGSAVPEFPPTSSLPAPVISLVHRTAPRFTQHTVVPVVNAPSSPVPQPQLSLPPKPTGLSGGVPLGTVTSPPKTSKPPAKSPKSGKKAKPINKGARTLLTSKATATKAAPFPSVNCSNLPPAAPASVPTTTNKSSNPLLQHSLVAAPPRVVVPKVATQMPINQSNTNTLAAMKSISSLASNTCPIPPFQQASGRTLATPIPHVKHAVPHLMSESSPSVMDHLHNVDVAAKRVVPTPFSSVPSIVPEPSSVNNLWSKPASKTMETIKREASEQVTDMSISPERTNTPSPSIGSAVRAIQLGPVVKVSESPAPPVRLPVSTSALPMTKIEPKPDPILNSPALKGNSTQSIPMKRLRSISPAVTTSHPVKKQRETSVSVGLSDLELTYPDVTSDSGWGELDPELDDVDRRPGRQRRQRTPTPELAPPNNTPPKNIQIARSPHIDDSARTPPRPSYRPRESSRSRSTSPVRYSRRAPYSPRGARGRTIADPRRPVSPSYYNWGPTRGRSPTRRGHSRSPMRNVDHWRPTPIPESYPPRPYSEYETERWRANTYRPTHTRRSRSRSPSPPPRSPRSHMLLQRGRTPPRAQAYPGSLTRAPSFRSNPSAGYGRMEPPRLPDQPLPAHAVPSPVPSRASSSAYDTPAPQSPPLNARRFMNRMAPPPPESAVSRASRHQAYPQPRSSNVNASLSPARIHSGPIHSAQPASPRLADRLSREHPSEFGSLDATYTRGRGRGRGAGAMRGVQQGRAKLVARLSDAPGGSLMGRIDDQSR